MNLPGGMPRRARSQLASFQQDAIFPTKFSQMEQNRTADNTTADDHYFCMCFQILALKNYQVTPAFRGVSLIPGIGYFSFTLCHVSLQLLIYCLIERRRLVVFQQLIPTLVRAPFGIFSTILFPLFDIITIR